MRIFLLAAIAVGALVLAGTDQSRAMPANGSAIAAGSSGLSDVVKVRVCTRWRYIGTWRHRRHYRRYCRY
jgi:hypothetical protein